MSDTVTITKEDLRRLLHIKIEAQARFSGAAKACRDDDGSNAYHRVSLDLAERDALNASCAADQAYHDALDAFVAQEEKL